jgi:excisionase family DNA binding protein
VKKIESKNSFESKLAVTLTVCQLRELIRGAVADALAENGGPPVHSARNVDSPQYGVANKPYLSVREAATLVRVGLSTIRLYIRKGHLHPQKIGRRIIIARTELERFISRMNS